jgi:TonB family protein
MVSRQHRPESERLIAALAAALLLHVPLLFIPLSQHRARPEATPVAVRLVALKGDAGTTATEQAESRPARTRAPASVRAPDKPVEVPEALARPVESVDIPEALARPRGPRRVDLFAQGAIDAAAEPTAAEPSPEGAELGQRRLDTWAGQFAEAERVRKGEVTAPMLVMGQRFSDWLLATEPVVLTALERRAPLGLGLPSSLLAKINSWMLETENLNTIGRANEHLAPNRDPLMDIGPLENFVSLCLGNCTGFSGHRVSYLVVIIEIEHDEQGIPEDWRVRESSGDKRFDDAALEAITAAVEFTPSELLESERPAEYSRWELSASAHRYGRYEMALDPTFIPPGDEVEKHSGVTGVTTVIKQARLVAVRYRVPAGG